MPRKKLTVPDMLAQKYYRSIMSLTNEFQGSDPEGYIGLQQIHYRYALQKDPKIPDHYKRKMKKFFGKELKELFKQSDDLEKRGLPRRIFRDCIPEGSHLSFYLKNLVDIGLLEKNDHKKEDNKTRYATYYVNYIYPVEEVFNPIKKRISPLAIQPLFCGDPDIGNLDIDSGVWFEPYFIGIPEEVFNPKGEFKKEFEEAFHKFEDGINEFGKFLRKNTKRNTKIPKNPNYGIDLSHKYGIYLELQLLSDIGIKNIKNAPSIDDEEDKI